ncbi:MAG: hypothetical protein AB7E85_01775 [Pseudobdellovibrionaceae bacterium]
MSETKKGAPPCGLYLDIPSDKSLSDLILPVRQAIFAINQGIYEKNAHILAYRLSDKNHEARVIAETLSVVVKAGGMIMLIHDDAALAKEIGAEGVILSDITRADEARSILGEDAIIITPYKDEQPDLYDAALLGDPARLPQVADILKFSIRHPGDLCLVLGPATPENCAGFVSAGASFLDASRHVWHHPKGPMQGVVNFMAAIDAALDQPRKLN